jgi:hypothetical protein
MAMREEQIAACTGHDDLLELLFSDLRVRLPPAAPFHMGSFLQKIRTIPIGLRAMAATFELDVSMALDDLGWHFSNWAHRGYCDETLRGCESWKPACRGSSGAQRRTQRFGLLVDGGLRAFGANPPYELYAC